MGLFDMEKNIPNLWICYAFFGFFWDHGLVNPARWYWFYLSCRGIISFNPGCEPLFKRIPFFWKMGGGGQEHHLLLFQDGGNNAE